MKNDNVFEDRIETLISQQVRKIRALKYTKSPKYLKPKAEKENHT